MNTVRFVVPGKPIGVNELYRRARRGLRKTDAAAAYVIQIAAHGQQARRRAGVETFRGPVNVELRIFFADERPDLDGPVKLILDALQASRAHHNAAHRRVGAGIIENDRQVQRYTVARGTDRAEPRVEIAVTELP
jgi:Holliday junction resolvase RusA-like endonuclease